MIIEELQGWMEELGDEIVLEAMRLAVKFGGRTFGYVEKILKEWSNKELQTIDQVKKYEDEKSMKHERHTYSSTSSKTKNLFDDLRKEVFVV